MKIPTWHPNGPGVVYVWDIDLDKAGEGREAFLSFDEEQRANRLGDRLRARFVAGRTALRHILSGYCGMAAQTLEFSYGANGKPTLQRQPQLGFNLTRAGGRALVAVAAGADVGIHVDVGIDMEGTPGMSNPLDDAACFLTPSELGSLEDLRPSARPAAFARMWTQKEAIVKAAGASLDSLDRLKTPTDGSTTGCVKFTNNRNGTRRRWWFRGIDIGPGHVATVAASSPIITLRRLDYGGADMPPALVMALGYRAPKMPVT